MGNWDVDNVGYFTPYLQGDKFDILKDGEVLCEYLNIDFDEVYSRTNTSYTSLFWIPQQKLQEYQVIGISDYKSAS